MMNCSIDLDQMEDLGGEEVELELKGLWIHLGCVEE
jgi:hypothetical protein